jgi:hypothetical protein
VFRFAEEAFDVTAFAVERLQEARLPFAVDWPGGWATAQRASVIGMPRGLFGNSGAIMRQSKSVKS